MRAALAAAVGAGVLAPLWALPAQTATTIAALLHVVAMLAALFTAVRAARVADQAMRRPRWLLAAALTAAALGGVAGAGYLSVTGAVPIPSLVDVFTLAWPPLAAYAFWLVPTRPGASGRASRLLADGAVAATALLFVSWLIVLEPLAATGRYSAVEQATQLTYPLVDVFAAAMVLSLLPRARADLRPGLNYIAAGLLLIAFSDSAMVLLTAQRGVTEFGWPSLLLQAGLVLLAFAGLVRARPAVQAAPLSSALDRYLPHLPVAVAVGVGIWHTAVVGPLHLDEALLAGGMFLALVGRQAVHTRDLSVAAEGHHRAAIHDGLTDLANRKAFFARLTEHIATPGSGEAAVLLCDLDGFKEVNDTLGHEAGDDVLRAYAHRLQAAAPDHLVARLGGDEFAILLVGEAVEPAAISLADSIIRPDAAAWTGSEPTVVGSIGLAVLRPGDTPADLVRRADLAMYSAKRSPTSQLAIFTDEMAAEADRRHLLVAALTGAVDRGEFRLVYQPLYRLADGKLAGAEALLRWTSPLLGAVPPDEFIPLAEDSGAICAIGLWVLEQSAAQVASWQREGRYLPQLFVNVSAAQFTDELPGEVAQVLGNAGVPAARLTLEITESQLPGLGVNRPMQLLRQAGVRIALDDFGTGYSSLAALARLPVDTVKIDRDFIRNLGEATGRPVMDAIINLAKALGLTTVAEGIEDLGQAAEANNAGIDIAQGYLFSRPLPAAELALRLPRAAPPALPGSPESADGAAHGVHADNAELAESGQHLRDTRWEPPLQRPGIPARRRTWRPADGPSRDSAPS